MTTYNNLPLYTIDINGDPTTPSGVQGVALVDAPAIKRGFLAFREEAPKALAFAVTSEERRIISGPLMLADTPIYRNDSLGEYYVQFPAPVIERIVQKFFTQGNQASVNLMHNPAEKVEGVTMFESFISDARRGIAPMRGHEDAPDGSWFGSFIVDNPEVWESVKAGTFTGFSAEGFFSFGDPPEAPADWWNDPGTGFSERERRGLDELAALLREV